LTPLIKDRLDQYIAAVDSALDAALPDRDIPQKKLLDAMRYSLFTGGKRLRPVMLLEFCRICGGDWRDALPFACALEMIHTYSLIHDDLPSMDNDDTRRGKPTAHIVYGEATALLAGSALLSAAFETMLRSAVPGAAEAALVIANASGLYGIAGGQELDLRREAETEVIHRLKTAAMFIAAAEAGCVLAGAPDKRAAAAAFGSSFGLGFQYADDCQDSGGDAAYRAEALRWFGQAKSALDAFRDTELLLWMTGKLSAAPEQKGEA
jgi:geranylgeranyl diphosphate synthase type II